MVNRLLPKIPGTMIDDAYAPINFDVPQAPEPKKERKRVRIPVDAQYTFDEGGNVVLDTSKPYRYIEVWDDEDPGLYAPRDNKPVDFDPSNPNPVGWALTRLPESGQKVAALPALVAGLPELTYKASRAKQEEWAPILKKPLSEMDPTMRPLAVLASGVAHAYSAPVALAEGAWHAAKSGWNTMTDYFAGAPVNDRSLNQASFDLASMAPLGTGAAKAGAGVVGKAADVGDLGVFAGRRAANNFSKAGRSGPKMALDLADALEKSGFTPDEIALSATEALRAVDPEFGGVSRGADGKWRFEIDDSQSRLNPDYDFAGGEPLPFREVLDHPDLFTAYPDLGDAMTSASFADENSGMFYPVRNMLTKQPVEMTVSANAMDEAGARSVLLHEGQHGAQFLEDFAPGATPTTFVDNRDLQPRYLAPAMNEAARREFGARSYKDIPRPMQKDMASSISKQLYHNTAGEVESRNVQRRADMTPEERRETPPDLMEDVLRGQQVVFNYDDLFNSGASSAEQGMFAGPKAKTADLEALKRAEELETSGGTPDAIWNETGWFRGADGQWRFEIDDSNSSLAWWKRTGILPEVIKHPEFYDAYPSHRDTRVRQFGGLDAFMYGGGYRAPEPRFFGLWETRPEISTSRATESLSGPDRLRSTMLHEMQHGVQHTEDFGRGANSMAASSLTDAERQGIIDSEVARLAPHFEKSWRDGVYDDAGQYIEGSYTRRASKNPNKNRRLTPKIRAALEAEARKAAEKNVDDLAYHRSSGEVEARNVQSRMDMTREERKATPPWKTQDVPNEQQIVKRDKLFANSDEAALPVVAAASREIDKRGFYSPSLEAAKAIKQEKGTVQQMKAQLLKAGAKPKELEAVGFDKHFTDPNAKVTRKEVEDFLRANRVELGEVSTGDKAFTAFDGEQRIIGHFRTEKEAQQALADAVGDGEGFIEKNRPDTGRYESYSTPGGIPGSYRENILTTPDPWENYVRELETKYGEGKVTPTSEEKAKLDQLTEEKKANRYISSHWPGVTNPLLHTRSKKFEGGTHLLDELQSDWGQRARDDGMLSPEKTAQLRAELEQATDELVRVNDEGVAMLGELRKSYPEIGERIDVRASGYGTRDYRMLAPRETQSILHEIYAHGMLPGGRGSLNEGAFIQGNKIVNALDREMDLRNKVNASERGVPSAPFISNTSDWVDLGLKQTLIDAARDPSVNRLAWTPGDVQAQRYGMESHIDGLRYDPQAQMITYRPTGYNRSQGEYWTVLEQDVPPSELSNYVGREVAEKLLSSEPVKRGQYNVHELSGLDLKVGGEGHKKFYGTMSPEGYQSGIVGTRLSKLVKGLDPEAARIEGSELTTGSPRTISTIFEDQWPGTNFSQNDTLFQQRFDEASAIRDAEVARGGRSVTYPSIEITPALRKKILDEGLSLFANKEDLALIGSIVAAAEKEGAGGGSPVTKVQPGKPFSYIRNTDSAQKYVSPTDDYAQSIEPAGRYLSEGSDAAKNLPEGWERGEATFRNPLYLDWGSGTYRDADNWKQVLSAKFGGKTGRDLSQAVRDAGYDGIVTHRSGEPSEIVDLTSFERRSSNPTVRAAQKRAADVPFEDKLAVQHNMRGSAFAHNMRSYDGNIPVPSLAISKAGQPLTNFGEISLFGDPSMAIPKGSNPIYPADAYTKRSPSIKRDVAKSADRDRLVEKLTGEKGKGYTLNLDDPYWDTNFRVGYLRSKGLTPPEGMAMDDWARNAIGYGERDAVEAFVNDFLDSHRGIIRERIDQGWSNDGERRLYKPHTLDNMVKASKGLAGSEDFDYGPNAWRAHTMRPFKNLAEIQENRDRIGRVPKEDMDAMKDALAEKGFRLTEAMGYRDTYADMVLDGLRHPDPEVRNLAIELRDDLSKLPTEYFEGKPQRAVGMDEFKLAAVPETQPDVARSLEKMGLDVRTYDKSKMGEFGEPITEILRSRPDLLFANNEQLSLPGIVMAGAEETPNRLTRAYHWTDNPQVSEQNKFGPFSHFGTAQAAEDRFIAPAGRFSVGEMEKQKNEPGSVVQGATYPVDLNIQNPLRVEDIGTHSPVNMAFEVDRALNPEGRDYEYIPTLAENVLYHQIDSLTDEQIKALGESMGLDWYYDEFGVDRSNIDEMRGWIKDEIDHNAREAHYNDLDDYPDITPAESMLQALTVYGSALDEISTPQQKADALQYVSRALEREGYDGLVYKNDVEGGGADSYIATKPGTVKSATTGETLFANNEQLSLPGIVMAGAEETPNRLLPQMKGDRPARELSQLGTYSKLGETINEQQMKAGNAQQWLNAFKKGGVKAQEIYWTGMDDWLKEQGNRKISKEEVAAAFKEREVKVFRNLHTKDGENPRELRERERESYTESLTENNELVARQIPDSDEWAIYSEFDDLDAEPISQSGRYASEQAAKRAIGGVAADMANAYVDGLTLDDLLEYSGSEGWRERTSQYMRDAPDKGENYAENVAQIGGAALERKGSRGRPARGEGDVHPDSYYQNSPGWTLEEDFRDYLSRGAGRVVHEEQSRWGQDGSQKGFREAIPQEKIDELKSATEAAAAHLDTFTDRFVGDREIGAYKIADGAPKEVAETVGHLLYKKSEAQRSVHASEAAIERYREQIERDKRWLKHAQNEEEFAQISKNIEPGIRDIEKSIADTEANMAAYRATLERYDQQLAEMAPIVTRVPDYVPSDPLEQVPYNGPPKSALESPDPLIREYAEWYRDQNDAQLRYNEAEARWDAALRGIEPGPFVMSTSDFTNLLSKNALHRAAADEMDWIGWSGPERMTERWGDHLADYYKRTVPDTMLKLARQHDPNAQIETFYPGNPPAVRGTSRQEATWFDGGRKVGSDDQFTLPFEASEMTPDNRGNVLDDRGKTLPNPVISASSARKITGVVHTKDRGGNSVYYLTDSTYEPAIYEGLGDYKDGQFTRELQRPWSHAINSQMKFRSREAAERAMREINEDLDHKRANPKSEESLVKEWEEKQDDVWEGYQGIRMSPEMQESIRKYGFPLFANNERAGLAAASAAGLDMSQEARMRRAEELGYDTSKVWYHGTDNAGFTEFEMPTREKTKGTGVFFAGDRAMAGGYNKHGRRAQDVERPDWQKIYDEAEAAGDVTPLEDGGFQIYGPDGLNEYRNFDEFREAVGRGEMTERGPGIYPVYLKKFDPSTMTEIDFEGRNWDGSDDNRPVWNEDMPDDGDYYDGRTTDQIARDLIGYGGDQSVLFRNVHDTGPHGYAETGDVRVVARPHDIRHIDADFDPTKADSDNIFSANPADMTLPAFTAAMNSMIDSDGDGEPDYGSRQDGTRKGSGYFGELQRPDGNVSTELSIGMEIDGRETEIPLLVPTLTQDEINWLLSQENLDPQSVPQEIIDKAYDHAIQRMQQGQSPFAN